MGGGGLCLCCRYVLSVRSVCLSVCMFVCFFTSDSSNKKPFTLYIEQECLNYSYLNSPTRSDTYDSPPNPSCDNRLSDGWYRFVPPAGYRMASTCVPERKCGTALTGWLNSVHPAMTDGIVSGEVCFNWAHCCQYNQSIQIRNCGRFFVYKLGNTFNCPMGFCGNNTGKFNLYPAFGPTSLFLCFCFVLRSCIDI